LAEKRGKKLVLTFHRFFNIAVHHGAVITKLDVLANGGSAGFAELPVNKSRKVAPNPPAPHDVFLLISQLGTQRHGSTVYETLDGGDRALQGCGHLLVRQSFHTCQE